MNQRTNTAKRLLREKKRIHAAWLQGASPITSEILAQAGFDVLVVDLEHGPGDILTLVSQVQAMQGHQAIPFARAMWNDFVHIKKVLDAGVYGVLVPYVNNAREAQEAVRAVKYPPAGIRGIAGSPRAAGYGKDSMSYLTRANEEICLLIAIETAEAAEHLDDILAIQDIDGIFIGPMDLATNMGHFGNPNHPEVQETIAVIEQKVQASNLFLATVAGSWEDAQSKFGRGYQMIISFSDTVSLGKSASQQVDQFHKAYPQR